MFKAASWAKIELNEIDSHGAKFVMQFWYSLALRKQFHFILKAISEMIAGFVEWE